VPLCLTSESQRGVQAALESAARTSTGSVEQETRLRVFSEFLQIPLRAATLDVFAAEVGGGGGEADDAAEEERGGFGDGGRVGGGERDLVGIVAAAEVLAAGCVVVVDLVRIRADGDEAVVGVAVEDAAVPRADVADERELDAVACCPDRRWPGSRRRRCRGCRWRSRDRRRR
jgi:hypothetical protein